MSEMVVSRRDRLRAETVAEIKQLAWAQLAEVGPRALSLRQVARQMGVTSSALYRYFPSVEALLGALTTDGFASLADRLEQADAASIADGCEAGERWLRASGAHRQWALDDPTAYVLVFGSACKDYEAVAPTAKHEMLRGVAVLFRVMVGGIASGQFDPSRIGARLTDAMRSQLRQWGDQLEFDLDEAALSACMFAWGMLHGTLALELFDHLPQALLPADALFDQNMRHVLSVFSAGDDRPARHGFRPLPHRGGPVSNALTNRIRDDEQE